MKRIITIPLIALALVVGAAVYIPVAQAQGGAADTNLSNKQLDADGNILGTPGASTLSADQTAAQNAAAKTTIEKNDMNQGYGSIMTWIATLFAWLVGIAALTLDYTVYFTIIKMGEYIHNLTAIGVTWRILRDIGNIALIFGFLAIGISVILDDIHLSWNKKMLPMLLVAAIFINFSLFFAEAIIDVSNLFATQIFTQINGGVQPTAQYLKDTTTGSEGISNKIMAQVGLQTIYTQGQVRTDVFNAGNSWLIGFMSIILFIVTAFVMFSLAFILIARFVFLVFLIVLAPLGFAGLAIPQLAGRAKWWWDNLFENSLTAPVLLLLLYIALAVITDASFLTGLGNPTPVVGGGTWVGFIDGNLTGFASVLLTFIIAMGLLLLVVIVAKRLSTWGSDWATKSAGKLSFGLTAWGLRATAGSAGNLLASKRMQSWARRGGAGGFALKGAVLAGKGLRGGTYDLRAAPGVGTVLGEIGVNAGEGSKLTPQQIHEAQYGAKPVKEWLKHSKEEREKAGHEMDFKDAQKRIEDNEALLASGVVNPAITAQLATDKKFIAKELSTMSTKQLEELSGIKDGVESLVANLSPQQFESLMKSDKLDQSQKDKIKASRYNVLTTNAARSVDPSLTPAQQNAAKDNVKKAIDAMSKGELESMPADMVIHPTVLSKLSDKQRDTIADSKERTAAEKEMVRNSSATGKVETIYTTAGGGPAGAAAVAASREFSELTTPQIVKLKKEILVDPAVAAKLTTQTLIKLAEENKLTPLEMQSVGRTIRGAAGADRKTVDYITVGPGAAIW